MCFICFTYKMYHFLQYRVKSFSRSQTECVCVRGFYYCHLPELVQWFFNVTFDSNMHLDGLHLCIFTLWSSVWKHTSKSDSTSSRFQSFNLKGLFADCTWRSVTHQNCCVMFPVALREPFPHDMKVVGTNLEVENNLNNNNKKKRDSNPVLKLLFKLGFFY